MGAFEFESTAAGRDAREAFQDAVREAQYQDGHGGYTGTIAEKMSFEVFTLPPRIKASDMVTAVQDYDRYLLAKREVEDAERRNRTAKRGHKIEVHPETKKRARRSPLKGALRQHEATIRRMARVAFEDKWGPACCLELTGSELTKAKARMGLKGTQKKVFIFFGIASA